MLKDSFYHDQNLHEIRIQATQTRLKKKKEKEKNQHEFQVFQKIIYQNEGRPLGDLMKICNILAKF